MTYSELVKFIRENSSYLTDQGGRLSRKYGVSKEDIKKARQEIKDSVITPEEYSFFLSKEPDPIPSTSITLTESNTNLETGEVKHVLLFDRPLTKEELEAHFHVDNINNKITNYWSILVKSGAGYATSVNIKNIAKDFNIDRANAIVNDFINNTYKELSYRNVVTGDQNLLLLNIADFHIDKENIENNDVEKRVDTYISLIRKILDLSSVHKIDKILYVVGNDYFNTDTILNTTTKGTPQNVIMNWDEAFKLGFDLQIHIFKLLQLYCDDIDVLHVSGNHDETKSYYLAYSLSRYFEESSKIKFLIDSRTRKQYSFGNTFFGFHHGNTNIDKLPLNFSKQFSEPWGAAKYHEIITADKHHYKQYELEGVRIHQMPSLTGVDNWHDKSNYNNSIQSALGMIYNSKVGKFAEFEVRIDDSNME